jgi:hypothetical protein
VMVALGMLYVEDALGDKNAKPAASPARKSR